MKRGAVLLFTAALVAMVMAAGIAERPTHAAVPFTVNSTGDAADENPGTGTCQTATPGECTLRAAIEEANANNNDPTVDVINFAIPGAGPHTISPSSSLPDITDPVTIDGYTQGDSTPTTDDDATENTLAVGNNAVLKIELSGPGAQSGVSGLKIKAADSTVRGLVISNWDNAIFLTVDALNIGATGNKVQGNYIGTDVTGTATDPDGIPNNGDELGNLLNGVSIETGAANNTIGGTTAAAGNVISGNGNNSGSDTTNTKSGVEVQFANSDTLNKATGNRILSNSIYDNARLGIDLYFTNDPRGHRQRRCPLDTDDGPNHLQNFPVITSAKLTTRRKGGHRRKVTLIKGTLNSEADKTYNVQFFASPAADPSGNGEGQTFLGQKSSSTDSNGDASFTFMTRKKVPKGQVVTATATDRSSGDTSEFSKACTVPGVPCP